jgi:hypothetical protein
MHSSGGSIAPASGRETGYPWADTEPVVADRVLSDRLISRPAATEGENHEENVNEQGKGHEEPTKD